MNTTAHTLPSVTPATFDATVLDASRERTVIVDFSAAWCGPCRALGPILAQLASEPDLGAVIVTVDADTEPELVARFGVRSLPTLLFFRQGRVVDQLIGLTSAASIRARIVANANA